DDTGPCRDVPLEMSANEVRSERNAADDESPVGVGNGKKRRCTKRGDDSAWKGLALVVGNGPANLAVRYRRNMCGGLQRLSGRHLSERRRRSGTQQDPKGTTGDDANHRSPFKRGVPHGQGGALAGHLKGRVLSNNLTTRLVGYLDFQPIVPRGKRCQRHNKTSGKLMARRRVEFRGERLRVQFLRRRLVEILLRAIRRLQIEVVLDQDVWFPGCGCAGTV